MFLCLSPSHIPFGVPSSCHGMCFIAKLALYIVDSVAFLIGWHFVFGIYQQLTEFSVTLMLCVCELFLLKSHSLWFCYSFSVQHD